MKHIANVSGGKDSLAQILLIMESGIPCDEVVFYDTGMEFKAIYNIFEKLEPMVKSQGMKLTVLQPKNPFLYDMLERPVESKQKGKHSGYGWCGGVCRWGTKCKTQALDQYAAGAVQYIGIAADEQQRRGELTGNKRSLLIENKITEAECLDFCRRRGWNWNEKTPATESGLIDLYDILDRVSCWCCANKNQRELRNIWRFLPQYWEQLKEIQKQIERPMKKWQNKQWGAYGNVLEMEQVFKRMEE
jgi:3'-phosphoadenosine 5'-phosphosulfate sulfotransferase (PAPS reductase)/FAD synthetase